MHGYCNGRQIASFFYVRLRSAKTGDFRRREIARQSGFKFRARRGVDVYPLCCFRSLAVAQKRACPGSSKAEAVSQEFPEFPSTHSMLFEILQNQKTQEKMMSALSDVVAALQATLTKLQTDNAKAFSDLEAAVAAGNPTDVANAVSALGAINTALQSMDTAALAADAAS